MAKAWRLQADSSLSPTGDSARRAGRNLVVLSDGTGNSAASGPKTNVWRLYQALDVTDGTQIAAFSDGVGTSNIKPLRILGQALGFGVQMNVIRLYKFLCRNYVPGDQIWAFGFSRGAFTIRVLAGLIEREGLVSWETEADLDRNALSAYRAFREEAFKSRLPWVNLHRYIRNRWTNAWNDLARRKSYDLVKLDMVARHRREINVRFIGVWDTVAAYGLPVQELTDFFNKWIWPLEFEDRSLLTNVENARHALSLDDDRRTFFPIPWDETKEKKLWDDARNEKNPKIREGVLPGRLKQVWFAGAHASVGGGYPDDGISLVALGWMIDEAQDKGLRFMTSIAHGFEAMANPTGRIYDPRSGLGALYRYQPRDVQSLLDKDNKAGDASNAPLVHGSVMTRIVSGTEGYAPISLPEKIKVLPPYGPPVDFTAQSAIAALADPKSAGKALKPDEKRIQDLVLNNTLKVARAAADRTHRADLFRIVQDTVWWRQINYFVSLIFVSAAILFPLLPRKTVSAARFFDLPDADQVLKGPVSIILDVITGFLPWFLDPWISAVRQRPVTAALIAAGLLLNLRFSAVLQGRICDRARAAWNMGELAEPLRLTGRRGATIGLSLISLVLFIGAASTWVWGWAARVNPFWIGLFFFMAAAFYALWRVLCHDDGKTEENGRAARESPPPKAKELDPTKPGPLLRFARRMRTDGWTSGAYRNVEKTLAPVILYILTIAAVLSVLNRGAFDLVSAGGAYCEHSMEASDPNTKKEMQDQGLEKLNVIPVPAFQTNSLCQPTGIRLVEGEKYRITVAMNPAKDKVDEEWFDKGVRTDVGGFTPAFDPDHFLDSLADSAPFVLALPLRRWWREQWFQPIVRIGKYGNNEHVLNPAAPLPVVDFKTCAYPPEQGDASWKNDISAPSSLEFRKAELKCEDDKHIEPARTLISDITADATGELFIYVNDAVLALPSWMNVFYKNNSGGATVEVSRIEADAIIAAKKECDAAEGRCSRAEDKK